MTPVVLLAVAVFVLVWRGLLWYEAWAARPQPRPPEPQPPQSSAVSPATTPPAPPPVLPPWVAPYVGPGVPAQARRQPAPLRPSTPPARRRTPPIGWDDVIAFGLALEAADDALAELGPVPPTSRRAAAPRASAEVTFGPSDPAS